MNTHAYVRSELGKAKGLMLSSWEWQIFKHKQKNKHFFCLEVVEIKPRAPPMPDKPSTHQAVSPAQENSLEARVKKKLGRTRLGQGQPKVVG
jgi:hypothetical protein